LKDTCARYLDVVEPLFENMEDTKKVTSLFETDAADLQEELKRLNEENAAGSWVSGFWESMYLELRDPLPVNTNPFFVFDNPDSGRDQMEVLATAIRATAHFHHQIRTGALPADVAGGVPLCTYQYPRIFGSARIPGVGRDSFVSVPASNHIVLNLGGHFFAFHVMNEAGEVISQDLCLKAIKKCTQDVLEHSMSGSPNAFIPTFTAMGRDEWAKTRGQLEVFSPQNTDILRTIDSAIAVFSVIENDGDDVYNTSLETFVNSYGWFDKQQVIVSRNGRVSINMEHTATDGHTMLKYFSFLLKSLAEGVNTPVPDPGFTKRAKPFYLDWQVPHDEEFEKMMEMAQENFDELRSSVSSNLIDFRVFGSEWIKSTGISPDAFAQLCFQLAHYRMFGEVASTYESVNMKKYLLGRTETGRPLTSQSKAFVQVIGDILAAPEQKITALRTAAAAHVKQISDCQKGIGVDRHLWALYRLSLHRQQRLNNYTPPALFSHESFAKVRDIILSTSTCGIPGTAAFGFGPVSQSGFGLGYGVFPHHIMVFITSFMENGPDKADLLAYNIQKAFQDCYALLESEKKKQ